MDHFIHYLKRSVDSGSRWTSGQYVRDSRTPFYAVAQQVNAAFFKPQFHVTRQAGGPVNSITAGSTIWIFSMIESPWGRLGPALDAKIVVKNVRKQADGLTRFNASESSLWYPLQHASDLLAALESVDRKGHVSKVWADTSKPPGLYLQSIRKLHNADLVEEWSDKLLDCNMNFISYRIKDGTEQAFLHAGKLLDAGEAVYWDRFCLPRRLTERREKVSGKALNEALMHFIDKSSRVWGIETPLYNEAGCYAQKEADYARLLNKYFPVQVPVRED